MTKLLLVPALLLAAACGDNLQPGDDQIATSATDPDADTGADTPDDLSLYAALVSEPYDCVDRSVLLRGYAGYSDGSEIADPFCRFELADGRVFDNCYQIVSIPSAQNVVLTVTDPATGTTARHEETIVGPPSFDVTLDASVITDSDGSAIAWRATTHLGDDEDVGQVKIDFDPITNVVIPDPQIFQNPFGVVKVTQPGTYTVIVDAFIGFGDVAGCSAHAEATVEVTTCSSGHAL